MLENIEVLCHACIKFNKEKIIYFDPFKIDQEYHDADIIFITHDHYDHYSEEDIDKVRKEDTIIVAPNDLLSKLTKKGWKQNNIMTLEPNQEYKIDDMKIETIPAYNKIKPFHPKRNGWVGYILEMNEVRYYIAGDTDVTDENKNVKCDVAFVPVGGTYTMNAKQAADLVNIIKPKIAVPIHYGSLVGTKQDAIKFTTLLQANIEGKILIKE